MFIPKALFACIGRRLGRTLALRGNIILCGVGMWTSIKRFQTYVLGFALLCLHGIALGQGIAWKTELKNSFTKVTDRIKQIIKQGETPAEATDFTKRFDNQSLWFDTTLAGTNNQTESSYYLLNQRRVALSNIVAMQEWAERVLKDRLATFIKPLPDYRRVRVLLLYDISNAMNKKSGEGVFGIANTTLTQPEIDDVVDRVLDQASREVGVSLPPAAPTAQVIAQTVAPASPEVMFKLDKLQAQVDEGLALSRQLQHSLQQGHETSSQQLKQAVTDAEARATLECKKYFVPRLEDARRSALGLQMILLDTNERLVRANDERKHWQAVAQKEQRQCKQAEQQATLTDELADRRLAELATFLDMKRTTVHESVMEEKKQVPMSAVPEVGGGQAAVSASAPVGHRAAEQEAESRLQLEKELEQRAKLERGLGK